MSEEEVAIGNCPVHGFVVLNEGKCPRCGTELKPLRTATKDVAKWLLMLLWP